MMSDLKEKIRSFLQQNFYVQDEAALADQASLLDSGIVDSTGILEVIVFIEKEFGFKVEDAEMLPDNLDSIARIEAYVQRRTGL